LHPWQLLAWLNPVVIRGLRAGTCAVLRGSLLIVCKCPFCLINYTLRKLENVAIAMHYHCIEASRRRASRCLLQLRRPYQRLTRLTYPFLSCSVFTANTLCYVVTSIFWLWPSPFTFYLWPWALAVYRLCRGQTLYQIWEKSSNPRRSYCDYNIWSNDPQHLCHVLRYALRNSAASMNFVNLSVPGV